jgi:hypothetical protein
VSAARELSTRVACGAAVGLLLGLVVGMSASPVVSGVIAALGAVLGGYVAQRGTEGAQPAADDRTGIDHPFVLSLALACVVGIFAGLYLRTHDLFSPSLSEEVSRWEQAGFTATDAMRFTAQRQLNLTEPPSLNVLGQLKQWTDAGYSKGDAVKYVLHETSAAESGSDASLKSKDVTDSGAKAPPLGSQQPDIHESVLYGAVKTGDCSELQPKNYSTTQRFVQAYILSGGVWKEVASASSGLDQKHQRAILDALWNGICK